MQYGITVLLKHQHLQCKWDKTHHFHESQVAIIAFAQSLVYPTSDVCFTSTLALVTPQNKQNFVQFINKLTTRQENAFYVTALNAAFALFTSSNNSVSTSPNRRRIEDIHTLAFISKQ